MKDLYKQLGLDASADEAAVRAATQAAAPELREPAEFILLDPTRRAVYDRNRSVLVTVGRLRANLGLNLSRFWPRSRFADFTIDLNPPPGAATARPVDDLTMAWALGAEPPPERWPRRPRRGTVRILAAAVAFAGVACVAMWYWLKTR